jgi:hypothetical protein
MLLLAVVLQYGLIGFVLVICEMFSLFDMFGLHSSAGFFRDAESVGGLINICRT